MLKKATVVLLTLILLISTLSAVSFTASAANNSRQLMVSGNHLVFVDEPTKTVRLTGVNVPGGEWTGTPGVEKIDRSVTYAIDNWKCNIIRLPVSINGWTGNYSYVSDGGKSYRNYIDSVISIASDRGAYVVLDLHHYTSFNKADYLTFWQEAAVKYANNPTVLFGILNEPHSTTWDVWRDGDGASVYGHQYVVEMIRDLGAKNIIVAGGLDWAYNVSGVVNGYALVDQGTNNNASKAGYGIMYDTHIYPWKGHTSNWDSKVGAVRKLYPILVGECGWDIGTINEIAGKDPQPGDSLYHDKWVPELLAWIDDDTTYGAKANYTGYCMHPSSAPQLITSPDDNGYAWKDANYSYKPTEYWGVYLVPHLEAAVATRYGTISSVQVTTMSIVNPKTTYNVGDSFDKSTGYLDVAYSDGTTAKVNLSDSGVTITGFNSSVASESQLITVAYGGKTATYTIVINDPNATVTAKSYLELDFEDAAYATNADGTDNYAIIQTTNKATGNKIDVNFYNSSDTNRYQVYTENDSKYVATKGRKTNSAFDFRPEQSVSDKSNKVYVELKVKRVSYSNDDPVSIVFTDDKANPIFRLNYTQNTAPVLVANATYSTVTYPVNGDWTYIRAIIDFSTSTFELYQGTSLSNLTSMVSGTNTFGFESSSAANLARITDYNIGNRKGSLAFDDIKIYTVGEGGSDTPAVTLSSISVSGAQTAYNVGDVFVAPTVTAAYSDGTTKTVTGAAFSGYNMAVAGAQTVTVSYGGKTTTYTINVAPPEKVVESIIVSDAVTQYTWGDTFIEPTVTAKYTNSYYADEVVTGANFLNYNMKEVRTQSVRVVYGGKATTYQITVSAPAMVISSIEVTGAKTDYILGEEFVVPSVIVKYTSDYYSSQVVTPTCTGYNMSKTGTQTVTASYGGKTTTYQITISNPVDETPTLESITVTGQRTGYNVGDAFIAPTVIGSYSNGTTKTLTGASFTGYNMSKAGTQTVTVTYEDKTTTYQITVTAVVTDYEFELIVDDVKVSEGATTVAVPLKITKMYADKDLGCLAVNVIYDTNKFTWAEAGGFTAGSMVPNPASDLIVAEPAGAGSILVSFTTADLGITPAAVAADNTFVTLNFTIKDTTTSFTSEISMTPGAKLVDFDGNVLISKTNFAKTLIAGTVTYTGSAPAPTLSSISVSGAKTSYTVGDAFVKPTVTAKYSDGSTKTVTNATFTGYNMSQAGTQTVTVTYEGKTTTYQITVTAPPVGTADFYVTVDNVTAKAGATTVAVPLKITKMYADKELGCLAVNVIYDTNKFTWAEAGGYTAGSMVPNPASDLIVAEPAGAGSILVSFTTADLGITPAAVAADNTFITLNFGVKDTTAVFESEISMTPGAKLVDFDGNVLISKSNFAKSLVAGTVTYPGAAPVTLSSISVSGAKTAYNTGDAFVKPTVTAKYSDGSTKTVTNATFTGYNMSQAGTQTVTVTYEGKTTTYQITVTAVIIDYDFELTVDDVKIPTGSKTVTVPLKITEMYDTDEIGCLAVNVLYDTNKFTWTEAGGYAAGSMIPAPAADLIVAEPAGAGSILVSFTTDDKSITPAAVAADNTFVTLTFTVKDSSAPFSSDFTMTPASKLNDVNGEVLIKKADLANVLVPGTVTVEKAALGYDVEVLTSRHMGYDEEGIDVYYVKSLVLTEGNGVYSVKVGDYDLHWSEERQCYVGVTAAENYDVNTKQFVNISINTTAATPVIKQYGDVTGDNKLNYNDLIAMKNYVQLGTPLPVRYAADTNLDGNINYTDLAKIRFYIEMLTPIF